MTDLPFLTTARLSIAIPGAKAAQQQADFYRRNGDHLRPWEPTVTPQHLDAVKQTEWLDAHVEMARNDTAYRFLIFQRDRGTAGDVIGHVNLHDVTRGICQWAILGYSLSYEYEGRGVMTEACEAVVAFAFDTLKLHRLQASYQTRNDRSAAVLRRLGFTIEGTAKAYLYIDGAWRDHVVTARVNPAAIIPA